MERIGKYEIIEEIGRGGFAVVYKAHDPDLDRVVALKVLAPHLTWDPAFAERFRREAQSTARLRHPHIVIIYEVGEAEGQPYIAMAYLPGRTLAQTLRTKGAMSLERVLPILEQVAGALDYAHGQRVIHRDVKPSNVMVEETERGVQATLMDFGLVKALESSESLTSAGTILGSPEYMAPEQADPDRKSEIGPATDRYALGVVAYEMLTGRVPFPGSTPSTLVAHLQKTPPDPTSIRENLPAGTAQSLLKALAKAPGERYHTARAMVEALRQTQAQPKREISLPKKGTKEKRKPQIAAKRFPVWAWGAAGALVLALLAIGVLWATLSGGKPTPEPTVTAAVAARPVTTDTPASPTAVPTGTPTRPEPTETVDPVATVEGLLDSFYDSKEDEDYNNALTFLSQAIQLTPDEASYYYERAKLNLILDEYELAMEDIEQAIVLEPDVGAYYVERGIINRENGDLDAALDDFDIAIELEPGNATTYIELANTYKVLNDVESAIEVYDAIIGLEPNDDAHYKARADLYLQQDNFQAAAADLEQAISINPYEVEYYSELGKIYNWPIEDYASSVENFNKALELQPDTAWFFAMRAHGYIKLGDLDAASDDINQAIELYSGDAWFFWVRGYFHMKAGEYHEAVSDFSKSLELDPNNANTYADRGRIYLYDLYEFDKALADYNQAIDLDPSHHWMFIDRAVANGKLGYFEEALADFESALDIAATIREVADVHCKKGITYLEDIGDPEAALIEFDEALNIDPDYAQVYLERGYYYHYLHAGDFDKALADLNRSIDLDPSIGYFYLQRGQVLRAMGNLESAKADFEHCLELAPENYWCHLDLGWLCDDLGDTETAVTCLREFLRLVPESACPECQDDAAKYIQDHGG